MDSVVGKLAQALALLLAVGAGPVFAEKVTYIHTDALGSPVAASDASGNLVWQEYYKPYGDRERLQGDEGNSIWYTGKEQDEGTLLVYMGARYYNPLIGRFVSTDPVSFVEGNVHSFNRYAYANNSPYGFVDPDGASALTLAAKVIYRGGDIAVATAGIRDDIATLRNPNSTTLDRIAAGGSLISELAPVSARDLKVGVGVAEKVASEGGTVIGRVNDLQNLRKGEKSLLDRLPDQGSPKANWKQNSGVLRQEMGRGQPIRDASPGDTAGQFLKAERNLLKDRGWTFDSGSNYWMPPK